MNEITDDALDLSDEPTGGSIQRLIGDELYHEFCTQLGGRRLYLPLNPGPSSPISASIGLNAAVRVCAVYGGMTLDVPLNARKHEVIRRLDAQGLTCVQIAHKIRVTRQTVMRVLKKTPSAPKPDLFSIPSKK